jgi:hypothetical protein
MKQKNQQIRKRERKLLLPPSQLPLHLRNQPNLQLRNQPNLHQKRK